MRIKGWAMLVAALAALSSCKQSKYDYVTVEGDEMNTKMYTLENGLKVYMTVNNEQPRIQTYIAVHVGSKHEPAETTGLAHYLEHMMFKGSSQFGTMDYDTEKVYLDQIRDLYEVYRNTTDEAERKAIYHQIDSVSYVASTYFIPNEYDKLMAHIGSDGSNAWTSYDQTVYTEDIPSNQIENWAKIESDRFKNMVLRGFHTELEAVYEEFNKYLNSDGDKLANATFEALTPTHPYNHSVIGLGEHLKNPSIVNIENFFHTYYVPNNMAICLSGDFDPDNMLDIIIKYFGDMEPNQDLKMPEYEVQPNLTEVVEKEIMTPNPESIILSWRFDGAKSHQNDTLAILSQVLHNGKAGLLDLDLNLTQKVNGSESSLEPLCDYTVFSLDAQPQPGQDLNELRELLMQEVAKLKNGEFSDDLLQSIKTEKKLVQQRQLEHNEARALEYVNAFINDIDWADYVESNERINAITKDDVVAFAQKHLLDNNYVCVYKRQGEDLSIKPVDKPAITPIQMNRDSVSAFCQEVLDTEVAPVEPVFLDYKKDLTFTETKSNLPVIYRQNKLNDLFTVTYLYDMGYSADRKLDLAMGYLDFLGTDSLSAEQIKQKFYQLGCQYHVNCTLRETTVTLTGLQENMAEAIRMMDDILSHAKLDEDAFGMLVMSKMQERQNILNMFDVYPYFMRNYLQYGLPFVELELTNEELQSTTAEELMPRIHQLLGLKHRVLYYGPAKTQDVLAVLDAEHKVSELKEVAPNAVPQLQVVDTDECFIYPYKGTTSFVMNQFACTGLPFDESNLGAIAMYNAYFGAGMNTVVFQEMREKRSLCYGAGARYSAPSYKDQFNTFATNIQSQNDKLADCISVFQDITNNMPMSETSFEICKQGLLTQLRTERTTGLQIINAYIQSEALGIDYDRRQKIYEQIQDMTLQDILKFQQKYVKDLKYRSGFAGDPAGMDPAELNKLGTVKTLSAHELFGY